jgi:hypothetical protein
VRRAHGEQGAEPVERDVQKLLALLFDVHCSGMLAMAT